MAIHEPGVDAALRVGTLDELRGEGCRVVPSDAGPIAVFYNEGDVRAVDNRCPHMGFPLHRGTVRDGILTCHWHHAQFDLASGCTFNLFADDVPTYPVELRGDEVWVIPRRDHDDVAAHWRGRLREGMEQRINLVIAKAVLGLLGAGVPAADIVREGVLFGVRNRAAGWGPGLTILTAMANVCERLPADEQFLPLYQGLLHVARDTAGQPPRRFLAPLETDDLEPDKLKRWFRRFVEVRDAQGAERCLQTLIASGAQPAVVADALLAAATDHFFLDGGHTLDFINKALEALDTIGWQHAGEVLPTLVGALAGARRAEEQQAWRHPVDLVPILRESFETLPQRLEAGRDGPVDEADLVTALLGEDPEASVHALDRALDAGVGPEALARLVAHAAALRIVRFGTQNEFGDWIGVLHTFTYCNAVHQAMRRSPSVELLRGVYHGAMAIYLDRFLNVPPARLPAPASADDARERLLEALNTQQQVTEAAALTLGWLTDGGAGEAWCRALTAATLREDAEFHTFQMLEAGIRQHESWPDAEPGRLALVAVARYLAAHSPTDRARRQTADIAQRLHRGDRIYEEDSQSG